MSDQHIIQEENISILAHSSPDYMMQITHNPISTKVEFLKTIILSTSEITIDIKPIISALEHVTNAELADEENFYVTFSVSRSLAAFILFFAAKDIVTYIAIDIANIIETLNEEPMMIPTITDFAGITNYMELLA